MKRGDLVKHIDCDTMPRWLYGGDEKCWDKWGRMIRGSEITFEFRDIGIVLLVKKLVPGKHKKAYIKILTSRGIGWIFENSLEVVK